VKKKERRKGKTRGKWETFRKKMYPRLYSRGKFAGGRAVVARFVKKNREKALASFQEKGEGRPTSNEIEIGGDRGRRMTRHRTF